MMILEEIQNLVKSDWLAVNRLISQHLNTKIPLINQLSHHIIDSGGKRMRPLLVLLSAKACHYQGDQHIKLAVAIEFFHTATLLHDDVVDESKLRRGKETANAIWGSKASVLVGDFLYTQALQELVACGNISVLDTVAKASSAISQGEVLQLMNCNDPDINEEVYMDIIRSKTGTLFSASTKIGAMIAEQDQKTCQALADFGLHLGIAFQLVDDILDYCSSSKEMGKNLGDDLAEGKPTLPIIYAFKNSNAKYQTAIRDAIMVGSLSNLDVVMEAIKITKAIEYTYEIAQAQVDSALSALQVLPESPFRQAMESLAQFSVERMK